MIAASWDNTSRSGSSCSFTGSQPSCHLSAAYSFSALGASPQSWTAAHKQRGEAAGENLAADQLVREDFAGLAPMGSGAFVVALDRLPLALSPERAGAGRRAAS
jgi:hypothetical protein